MDNTIAQLIRGLARCQLDGEGDCDEHGFVIPDYNRIDDHYVCPRCGEDVEPFDMPSDSAVANLSRFIVAARSLIAAGKVS